jgi:hypothetical protein
MTITLTWGEVMQAAHGGLMRRVRAMQDKRRPGYGLSLEADSWGIDIEGCCTELAAALALNLSWSATVGLLRLPDIGRAYQVRSASKPSHRLILRPDDPDDAVFIFVVGRVPTYELVGWIRAADGKLKQYWVDPGNGRPAAYFVPTTALQSLDRLRVERGELCTSAERNC